MNRAIAIGLMALGLVVATSFGARLGDRHLRYREAAAAVAAAGTDAERAEAIRSRDAIGLPTPGERVAQWFAVAGPGWITGSLLILAGALLARRQLALAHREDRPGAGGSADFAGTVRAVLDEIGRLEAQLADLPMDADAREAREAIDRLVDERIGPLVDARGQLVARHGVAIFAEYFGPFSGGERNLARTWSALTDGHAVEARAALRAAAAGFEQALARYAAAEAGR